MNIQTDQHVQNPSRLALVCALLAALYCVLLYDNVFKLIPLGINVPLYLAAFYAMLGVIFQKTLLAGLKRTVLHLAFIAALCCTFVLTNNPLLLTLNAILIILLVGEQTLLCMDKTSAAPYSLRMIGDSLYLWFAMPIGGVRGAFAQYKGSKNRFTGILIGVAITIPVLFAVIPLLMSGDAVFNQIFSELFGVVQWGDVVGNILMALLLFTLFSGLLWSLLLRQKTASILPAVPRQERRTFNSTASFMLLIALGVVLIAFCAVQFMYLFSGRVPDGMSYADYARSGFWQLLAVAVIVIALVFLLLRFSAPCAHSVRNMKRVLMTLVLLCTVVLLISSFSRMTLYEQSYGFSRLRLFTQFFMVALFLFLIISIARLWLVRIDLKKCACLCFLGCYTVLALFNIDAFIARENVKNQGVGADTAYLSTLGPDALPYYIGLLDPACFETAVEEIPDREDAYDIAKDKAFSFIDDTHILVYKDENFIAQAYNLHRIMRDLRVSDDWRYINAGRSAAREALANQTALIENINKIRDAFASPRK